MTIYRFIVINNTRRLDTISSIFLGSAQILISFLEISVTNILNIFLAWKGRSRNDTLVLLMYLLSLVAILIWMSPSHDLMKFLAIIRRSPIHFYQLYFFLLNFLVVLVERLMLHGLQVLELDHGIFKINLLINFLEFCLVIRLIQAKVTYFRALIFWKVCRFKAL